MPSDGLQIRPAKESDVTVVVDFIRKLAEYGDISSETTVTEADVRAALFGPRPVAEALLAYVGDEPAGFAVFSFTFSSFMGKPGIYVEDLFVEHRFRGHGVGKALLITLAQRGRERGCGRLEWSVLNWNEQAMEFYQDIGAVPMEEWTTFRLTGEALERPGVGSIDDPHRIVLPRENLNECNECAACPPLLVRKISPKFWRSAKVVSGKMPESSQLRRGIRALLCAATALLAIGAPLAAPAAAREREPNSVYAERRARLVAQLNAPVVLFGFTGKEDSSPSYVFLQEPDFYYLTGHNEEGAALLLVPAGAAEKAWKGPKEILFLPPRDPEQEKWDGPRMGPADPGIQEKTGFAAVEAFPNLKGRIADLAQSYHEVWTLLPHSDDTGYPHAREWSSWITEAAPELEQRDVAPALGAMRQIKSPGEIALLTKAIDLSVDAQLAAMRMVRPGLYEYQVAARMVEIHSNGGCETEAYSPIVGTGLHSTILHFNELDGLIQDGDVVLMDVGGQYSGYTADITRTIPANGHFTPRQREIYEIVLGAQNAVLAAMKPGMTLGRGSNSLFKIAYDYINTHGADREGHSLGRYFIHGLGHHIGLEVHDAGDPNRSLEPGMVVTDEPGIYIPEEKIGVRIEDDVLITPTGYKLLTARLPRTVDEIEKIMSQAKLSRAQ